MNVVRWVAATALLGLAGCASRVPLNVPTPRAPLPAAVQPAPLPVPVPEPMPTAPPPPAAVPMPVPSPGTSPVPAPAPSPSPSPAPDGMLLDPTSPLASEQRWLGEWFGGTPVGISAEPDGALLVSVPLEFSFDATMSTVKPPLAAVLARITSSLSRKPEAQIAIAAPADAGGPSELARERTVRIREHFYARGINLARIVELEDPGVPGVQLRLLPPPMR